MAVQLGRLGLWTQPSLIPYPLGSFAADLEEAGYSAIWFGGAQADLPRAEEILGATRNLVYATGILNVWTEPAERVIAGYDRVQAAYPGRLLLGLGIGHPEREDNAAYTKPYASLVAYLNKLAEIPQEHLALAALGPKVLRLSADRTAGAHPYFTTPEHTKEARELLGTGPLLVPEQKVVLETDPAKARAVGRETLGFYLRLVNYRNNWLRLGFTEADFADGGSDALVDATVAWGDAITVAARIRAHLDAGADQVTVQPLGTDNALPVLQELSAALGR